MSDVPATRDPLYDEWGARIREARLACGFDQTELAERLGVGQQLVSRWELGQLAPRDRLRPRLAAVVGRDVQDLFPYPKESAKDARRDAA